MSVESYGVERYVTGGMHVHSVRQVLVRVDKAAVDEYERRNPEISSRIVILAQRVPRVVALLWRHVCEFLALHKAVPLR